MNFGYVTVNGVNSNVCFGREMFWITGQNAGMQGIIIKMYASDGNQEH